MQLTLFLLTEFRESNILWLTYTTSERYDGRVFLYKD